MKCVYLDFNATAPVHPDALKAMLPFLSGSYGNPSSLHLSGRVAKDALEDARAAVALSLRCLPEEVFFTSGATESNNLAITGILRRKFKDAKPVIATTLIEHGSTLSVYRRLEKEGFRVVYMRPSGDGAVPPEEAARALSAGAVLLSVMLANNETGVIQPVAEMSKLARTAGAYVHCDAVQAYGKMPLDVDALGVDLLSLSAHKAYAAKGVGALYVRKGVLLEPMSVGGLHERGLRPGTENVPGIAGFGRMAELVAVKCGDFAAHELMLRNRLEDGLREKVSDFHVNGVLAERLSNTTSAAFEGVEAAALASALDRAGVEVSTASACSSGSGGPSHVLKEMGVDPALALGTIRISNGIFNTVEDIDFAIQSISSAVAHLRGEA